MTRQLYAALLLLVFSVVRAVPGEGAAEHRIDLATWTAAEDGRLSGDWRLLTFPSIAAATSYAVVQDPVHGQVVEAYSAAAAGAIGRSLLIDPRDYPILNWSWKIAGTIPGSSLSQEGGDDFPVRVMISFTSGGTRSRGPKDNILCYVWASTEPVGTVAGNPVHSHIKTFVVQSGNERSGDWQTMSRNLVADYRLAFAEEPGSITGLVLMTDSDDTGSEARGWYGPLWLSDGPDPGPQTSIE